MGIKGLFKILNLKKVNIDDLKDVKKIAIDISCWLHRVKYAGGCALGLNSEDTSWELLFYNIFKELRKYFELVFVFDGKTPEEKRVEHERRRESNHIVKKMYVLLILY